MSYFNIVKNKLLNDNISLINVNFTVNKYQDAVNEWIKFKKTKKHDDYSIYCIFSFHMQNSEHIILYHKKYDINCLLFCKINNVYKNILIPCDNSKIFDKDIIATYL
tara:strand:+ start:279 stop:599 length:321 start_codon:yes stop_codon:yes gene_type:complete